MRVVAMAKKKTPASKAKPAGGPETWSRKPLIVNLRGSTAFKAWLQELAAADRQSVSGVIERAVVHYARAIGFGKKVPRR